MDKAIRLEMEIKKIITYLILIMLFFQSCDCLQHVQGYVVDSSTSQPIDSVSISQFYKVPIDKRPDDKRYSDSIGGFEYMSISGGLFRCPSLTLYYDKAGYEIYEKKYRNCCRENDTIRLKRLE